MSWRVVVVTGRCKLEYRLGYLVCRGEDTKKVYLNEINTLIIESTAVALTSALVCELVKNKVNIIFCEEKHNPIAQVNALYGRHDTSGILKKQIKWQDYAKGSVWAEIIRLKIKNQYLLLKELNSPQAELLKDYLADITFNDGTNREGHAAKVYFNALFGLEFKRGDKTFVNGALNYGYSIILSTFNREIVANGYDTRIGIQHRNEFNHYNLACDLMEPFRILVDRFVFSSGEELDVQYKRSLANILNKEIKIGGKRQTVLSAISIYVKSVLRALETENTREIICYEL